MGLSVFKREEYISIFPVYQDLEKALQTLKIPGKVLEFRRDHKEKTLFTLPKLKSCFLSDCSYLDADPFSTCMAMCCQTEFVAVVFLGSSSHRVTR